MGIWKSTGIPNFDEISRSTAEIKLLPVSENGIWNLTYSYSIPAFNCRYRHVILHRSAKRRQNRTTLGVTCPFLKMVAGSHIGFDLGNIRPPTTCNCWSLLDSQSWP